MDLDKKKILIFATAYYPFFSGAEVAIREITDRLPNREFHLITSRLKPGLPKQEKIGNVTVFRFGLGLKLDKFLLPLFGLPFVLKLHNQYSYKLAWSLMASQAGLLARRFTKRTGLKLFLTLQEGDEEEYLKRYVLGNNFLFKKIILPLHRSIIKSADHIQVISRSSSSSSAPWPIPYPAPVSRLYNS